MYKRHVQIVTERIEQGLLPYVRRPGRYIGGEINQIKKDLASCRLRVGLCFPDVYEVGMSSTGFAVIYEALNRLDDVAAERIFAPWIDAEGVLREKQIPLYSLESHATLSSFDVLGFSLSAELCYTNVLNMLDLGGLDVRSRRRAEADPLVIAGGGMANCCEPIAEFIDLFVIGEAEDAVVQLADMLARLKSTATKEDVLLEASRQFEWAYVPRFYRLESNDGQVQPLTVTVRGLRTHFRNAVVADFEHAVVPARPIVPVVEAVHERVSIEIMRGCPGRCAFCQASFCRRPVRSRSVQRIRELAAQGIEATGFDTVSLLSLSSADYPQLEELVRELDTLLAGRHVGLSVPSLRVDEQLKLLPEMFSSVRKAGLTIAVEAASDRLRRLINKPLSDADLLSAVEAAYRAGWQKLKLYFMVGLPGETSEDIGDIITLCDRLAKLRRTVDGKIGQINAAVSWLVPKPHTPLSWFGQRPQSYFLQARELILDRKRQLRAKSVGVKFHHIERSVLESAIGRGDRRLADVIETAWRNGCRFDLWDECFDFRTWREAFAAYGVDLDELAQRQLELDQWQPWQHLGGPDQQDLIRRFSRCLGQIQSGETGITQTPGEK